MYLWQLPPSIVTELRTKGPAWCPSYTAPSSAPLLMESCSLPSTSPSSASKHLVGIMTGTENRSQKLKNLRSTKHIPSKAGAATEVAMATFAPTLNVSSFLSSATRISQVYVEYQVGGVSTPVLVFGGFSV